MKKDPSVFCGQAPFKVRVNEAIQEIDLAGMARVYDYGKTGGLVNESGVNNCATLIASAPNGAANTVLSASRITNSGIPGRIEPTDKGLKIANLSGDGFYPEPLRTTIASFGLPADQRLFWNMQVQFGDDVDGERWQLTPSGVDPCLIWQIKAPDLQPSIAMVVDTDDTDPTKLMLFFSIKTQSMVNTKRAGEIRGLLPHQPISILMEAVLDEKEINGKGYWKVRVNDVPVIDLTGPTLSFIATQPHLWYCGLYRYYTKGPATISRVSYWSYIKMLKF